MANRRETRVMEWHINTEKVFGAFRYSTRSRVIRQTTHESTAALVSSARYAAAAVALTVSLILSSVSSTQLALKPTLNQSNLPNMDMCKDFEEKQDAMEVNGDDDVDLDVSAKVTKEKEKLDSDCVVPVTPNTVRENGDFDIQSPLTLTVVRKQLNQAHIDSPRTPIMDVVFDPFAPGPDKMAHAPHSNKYLDEFRNTVARRLSFHHASAQPFHHPELFLSDDEDIFVSMYENLLEFIVSKTSEGVLAQFSDVEYDFDDFKTPPSPFRFNGIADDTCPDAPLKLKPDGKPRIIQVGLCKKLEF